jgi:NADH-quinone oxidoreductase subunit M
MVFTPLAGAVIQGLFPGSRGALSRWLSLGFSALSSVFAAVLVLSLQAQVPGLQASDTLPWIGSYAINYDLGIDGMNALLVLLVSIVFPVLIATEWPRNPGVRGIHGLFLLLQTALLGAVCAQDLFLLFFFWTMTLFPLYFLIGIWGGEKRETAALHSVVSGSIGNALMFAALVLIYYSAEPHTFSLAALSGGKLASKTFEFLGHELSVPFTAFFLIASGLALRVPVWPLHAWFTRIAVEAPSSVFVAVAAAVVPAGCYIFVKLGYSLFPDMMTGFAIPIMVVGSLNLVLGAVCGVAEKNIRLLPAWFCLSEVGFILVGSGSLSGPGVLGAVFQQLVVGLGLAGFGLFAGIVSERTRATDFRLGGVIARAPHLGVAAGIVIASLLGFPGLGGFVGHSLLILGSYAVMPMAVVLAGLAILVATYSLFTMYHRIFFGREGETVAAGFPDLSLREKAYLLPVIICLLLCGIYPKPLLELARPTVQALIGVSAK